ncbi:MAG: WbqC family protein [Magnetococcus sp. YQC-5]
MSVIAIHQPHYFPWLGLLHKILSCDRFIILDSVQFNRRAFQNRALYASRQGVHYLTIPVHAPNHQQEGMSLRDLVWAGDAQKIRASHFQTLRHRYGKTPGWHLALPDLTELLLQPRPDETVCGLIIASIHLTLKWFGVDKITLCSSSLAVAGHKDELMLNLTQAVGGQIYLSGQGAKAYTRPEVFTMAQVGLRYQEFTHPEYPQTHGGIFVPGCMALDLFFENPKAAQQYAQNIDMERIRQQNHNHSA